MQHLLFLGSGPQSHSGIVLENEWLTHLKIDVIGWNDGRTYISHNIHLGVTGELHRIKARKEWSVREIKKHR